MKWFKFNYDYRSPGEKLKLLPGAEERQTARHLHAGTDLRKLQL